VITPTQTPTNLLFIFFCGALAICAMILPGISGAFILLLIGKYEYMINALISFDLPVIIVFALGCVIGLISFSHFLSWLLDNYRYPALALLAGFMIGSLNKVWPWKEVVAYRLNHEGLRVPAFDRSVLPAKYLEATGQDPQLFHAILFAAVGIFLVVAIEKTAAFLKSKH
jgi:putative membrane protein